MPIQPYLFFEGRCDEALDFYQLALDAEITMLMRFHQGPDSASCAPALLDKVMHANIRIGETELMVSDGFCQSPAQFAGFALSITHSDEAQVDRFFSNLAEGGEVIMPLGKTFWSPKFGMVKDRFGVLWMVQLPGVALS